MSKTSQALSVPEPPAKLQMPSLLSVASTVSHASTVAPSANKIGYDIHDNIFYVLYFFGRYLVLFTSLFLCIISSLYGIGGLINLEATDFFCPRYTEEEVRNYNLKNGNQYGDGILGCWYINRQRLNYNAIFNLSIDIFNAKINNFTIFSILQTILYSIITIILLISVIYNFYYLLYDTYFAIKSFCINDNINNRIRNKLINLRKFPKKNLNNNDSNDTNWKTSNTDNKNEEIDQETEKEDTEHNLHNYTKCCTLCCKFFCENCCKKCWICTKKRYFKYIYPWYYIDSKWRILSVIIREFIEIFIQFYALLLYGGINLFNINSNVLSQEPYIIEVFAIIISLNCICAGSLLISYIIWHNILYGKVFLTLNFVMSYMFHICGHCCTRFYF